jgi:hypothetical protein
LLSTSTQSYGCEPHHRLAPAVEQFSEMRKLAGSDWVNSVPGQWWAQLPPAE